MNLILQYFVKEPKVLFLVDAIGAFLTATFIGVVMRNYVEIFGLPSTITIILTFLAVVLVCFSGSCYQFVKQFHYRWLFIIATANSLYILFSIYILFSFFNKLTPFGIIYLISEISTILLLVSLEISVAKKLLNKKINL